MYRKMEILGQIIEPGKSYQLNLDIARLHTRTKLEIPIIVSRAKKDGPSILISAGIHGNEINGVEIVRQLVAGKHHIPDTGLTICVPVVNVFGFIIKSRYFPDGRDLNRSFPGSKKGSLAARFAYEFMQKIVPHVDYCIDVHTGGNERFNFSQIRIDSGDNELLEMAKAFGVKFIKYSSQREQSFRCSVSKLGKKAILFEGGKSLSLDRRVTKSGLQGIINVLEYLGVKNKSGKQAVDELEINQEQLLFSKSKWVRANYSGLFRSIIRNGSKVTKGDVIGTISDPYGFFETKVKASVSGYLICLNHTPIINQGDALAHIAMEM